MRLFRLPLLVIIALILLPFTKVSAFADVQIEVSGNGADTANAVTNTQNQSVEIQQQNAVTVSNTVDQAATTGDNQIENTVNGSAAITTGSIDQTTTVENSLNTSSLVLDPCCQTDGQIVISGNGTGSQNAVNNQVNSTTNVAINQIATITNIVNAYADTGNNIIRNTSGPARIETGSIAANIQITNTLNESFEIISPSTNEALIKIVANGSESINTIKSNIFDSLILFRNNQVQINNQIYTNFNTGHNLAQNNLNDVFIKTGDINSVISIVNGPINTGGTDIICCEADGTPLPDSATNEENPKAPPPAESRPSNGNTAHSGNGSNGGSVGGTILGALVDSLPITGAAALHFWIYAVVYLVMFLSGLYVRLRAGRSPNRSRFTLSLS